MSKGKRLFFGFGLAALIAGCAGGNNNSLTGSSVGDEYRRVGRVVWHKEQGVNALNLSQKSIPDNAVGVFFYRVPDNDNLQSSANVAINGRFQVSLQPNHFSQTYSCTGVNDFSVEITGHKNNELRAGVLAQTLEAGKNYYFLVDVDEAGVSSIQPVEAQVAIESMAEMTNQSHQISRVVANCPKAEGPARMKLHVLFDTDKHFVKEQYYAEIQRVADFMSQYPNTTAVIEGHTDSRASDDYNKALSQRRVDAVRKILIEHFGVDASRLSAVGYGESRPIATNDTSEGRQQNRRVIAEFTY